MKFSVILNIAQSVCLLLLVVLAIGHSDNHDNNGNGNGNDTLAHAVAVQPAPVFARSAAPALSTARVADETLLRKIIREELAALNAAGAPAKRAPVLSPEEHRLQRAHVSDQINYYKSVGNITATQMHELQREIAALDDAGRREMLSKLTRAMNARQIEGQL